MYEVEISQKKYFFKYKDLGKYIGMRTISLLQDIVQKKYMLK